MGHIHYCTSWFKWEMSSTQEFGPHWWHYFGRLWGFRRLVLPVSLVLRVRGLITWPSPVPSMFPDLFRCEQSLAGWLPPSSSFPFSSFSFFFSLDKVPSRSPSYPGAHYAAQACLKLIEMPVSASRVQGLKVWTTKPSCYIFFQFP